MTAVRNVLIVGGGTAGSALAILLARGGVAVEVAEIKPDLGALGSGITLQGNALRVLRDLGVWNRVLDAGYPFDSLGLRAPDGALLAEIPDARTGGPDLPATLGMNRPELAAILADAVHDAGAKVRLGLTANALTDLGDGVRVDLSDGTTATYDLVVGADGIRSTVRGTLGIDVAPHPTGMGIWRIHTRRPREVERTDLVYGGPCFIAGYCPTGPDTMYAYLVESARPRDSVADADKPAHMRALAEGYGGVWDEIRDDITDPDRINYTWFESLLVDRPWNRGRVVLIGDAAAVIRRPGRDLTPRQARDHILGYTIFNDWSARDLQSREMQVGLGPCKGKDFASTLGPWIVTADELEPYRDADGFLRLGLNAAVNGRVVGRDLLSNMSWTFEELVAYASRGAWLQTGDVLGSGTCGNGGCLAELWGRAGGQDPPPLRPGDTVTLTVEGIGVIANTVVPGPSPVPLPAARHRPRTRP